MKRKSVSPIGALHPVLFFAGVYIVALFFSVFICSSLFYSCNTTSSRQASSETRQPVEISAKATAMVVVR
jgi:hypothetical protein